MTVKITWHQESGKSSQPLIFDRPNLMLVEGQDDAAFAARQIALAADPALWHIHTMKGKTTTWKALVGIAIEQDWFSANGRSISLVRDADRNAVDALKSAQSILRDEGLPVPGGHAEIHDDDRWRSAIFIMPNGTDAGALEELLIGALPAGRINLARRHLEEVAGAYGKQEKFTKAWLQVALAGQRRYAGSVRTALQLSEIFENEAAFDEFRSFLREIQAT